LKPIPQIIKLFRNVIGMVTAKAGAQRRIHRLHMGHDCIDAPRIACVFKIEIRLGPFDLDQQVFPQDFDPVEPDEIVHLACCFFDSR
jgi:hypothetical protein